MNFRETPRKIWRVGMSEIYCGVADMLGEVLKVSGDWYRNKTILPLERNSLLDASS
jgi:hypothetical protein